MLLSAETVAEPLGLFDCCGVSDGAACAIVATPEVARSLGKKDMISIKALQVAVSNGLEAQHNSWEQAYNDPELYKWFLEHKRDRQR